MDQLFQPLGLGTQFTDFRKKVHHIDEHGNTISSASLLGDGHRQRHDSLKHTIRQMLQWSRIPHRHEVLNMFTAVISNTTDLQTQMTAGKRQAIIPDFYFPDTNTMADVKTISVCKSHYKPCRFHQALMHDAVRIRQNKVTAQYRYKAKKADEKYNNHKGPAPGPVQTKLATFGTIQGLIGGAFAEASPHLHKLVTTIAEFGGSKIAEQSKALDQTKANAIASRYVHKVIGIELIRGAAAHRVNRLNNVLADPNYTKAATARRHRRQQEWFEDNYDYYHRGTIRVRDRNR